MLGEDTGKTGGLNSRWPVATDRAFIDVHPLHGALVAKRTDERLYRMINGYCETAHQLVELSETEPHLRQNFIYPVVFLYRQSIELHLKYLLMAYARLAGDAPDFRNHDLVSLWSRCKRVFQFFEGTPEPADKEMFEAVEGRITEFDVVDPGSDAFRFAHDTKGQGINLPMSFVNLPNLRKVVASLHNFLECVDWQLAYGFDIAPCEH